MLNLSNTEYISYSIFVRVIIFSFYVSSNYTKLCFPRKLDYLNNKETHRMIFL